MAPEERWLAAVWPSVRGPLPPAPAVVVEIGCGPLGGFVPRLEAAGYEVTGIDPEAPPGSSYRRAEFEHSDLPGRVDAIVACTSLHHVDDLAGVLDLVHAALLPGGTVVVVEWARERFGEATARWCFGRLPEPGPDPGWLHRLHAEWQESGRSWDAFLLSWVQAEGLHAGLDILNGLDARFDCRSLGFGPYFFPDLAGTSEADEQAAIDAGLIEANRIHYVGHRARLLARRVALAEELFDRAGRGGLEVEQPGPFRCDGDGGHLLIQGAHLGVEPVTRLWRQGAMRGLEVAVRHSVDGHERGPAADQQHTRRRPGNVDRDRDPRVGLQRGDLG